MSVRGRTEVGLGAATFLEIGLTALQEGDIPRAAGALTAIDSGTWQEIAYRLPGLVEWIRDVIEYREGSR